MAAYARGRPASSPLGALSRLLNEVGKLFSIDSADSCATPRDEGAHAAMITRSRTGRAPAR